MTSSRDGGDITAVTTSDPKDVAKTDSATTFMGTSCVAAQHTTNSITEQQKDHSVSMSAASNVEKNVATVVTCATNTTTGTPLKSAFCNSSTKRCKTSLTKSVRIRCKPTAAVATLSRHDMTLEEKVASFWQRQEYQGMMEQAFLDIDKFERIREEHQQDNKNDNDGESAEFLDVTALQTPPDLRGLENKVIQYRIFMQQRRQQREQKDNNSSNNNNSDDKDNTVTSSPSAPLPALVKPTAAEESVRVVLAMQQEYYAKLEELARFQELMSTSYVTATGGSVSAAFERGITDAAIVEESNIVLW